MTIKPGSTVSMNYTLKVGGKTVDSSIGKEPLVYVQGAGNIIPGLEKFLEGMAVGEKKHVVVPPEEGYGVRDPQATKKIPKTAFTDPGNMKVGDVISGSMQGQEFQATVASVGKSDVTLDFNHPLAGKTLNFDVEIMDIKN